MPNTANWQVTENDIGNIYKPFWFYSLYCIVILLQRLKEICGRNVVPDAQGKVKH